MGWKDFVIIAAGAAVITLVAVCVLNMCCEDTIKLSEIFTSSVNERRKKRERGQPEWAMWND